MKRKKVLLGIALVVASTITTLLVSGLATKTGGTAAYVGYPGNRFDFIVRASDFTDDGYYKPHDKLGIWVAHSPGSDCESGGILKCFCSLPVFMDPSQIDTRGWPLIYAYSHNTCGIHETYLPIAAIIDFGLAIAVYASAIAVVANVRRRLERRRPGKIT